MALEIDTIASAIVTTLMAAVPEITHGSHNDYMPPIETTDTALIVPPFGHELEMNVYSMATGSFYYTHRLRLELWVKHTGSDSDLTTRARTVLGDTVEAINADPTFGGAVSAFGWYDEGTFDYRTQARTDDILTTVGNAVFLRCEMQVPVADFTEV